MRFVRFARTIAVTIVVLAVAAAATIWALQTDTPSQPVTVEAGTATIEWVIDGDTVDLIIAGEQERIRLIGIDAPESVSHDTPEQCFGKEASLALKGLLPVGSTVRLERDEQARDRFGRLLLYIYRADDGVFVNRWLVENGFADALFFEPNTAFRREFTELRNQARSAPLGLWANCDGPDQPLE